MREEGDGAKLDDLYAPEFEYHMRFPGQVPCLAGKRKGEDAARRWSATPHVSGAPACWCPRAIRVRAVSDLDVEQ